MPLQRDPQTKRFLPTGREKCKNHPGVDVHGNGLCENCWSQDQRDRNTPYAQKQQELRRVWQQKNSATWQRERYRLRPEETREQKRKRWAGLSAERRWEKHIKGSYGLTAEEYYRILELQAGCCAICHTKPTDKKLVVDHRHAPVHMEIRGLLCGRCNSLVGYIEKTGAKELERAISYASRLPLATKAIRNRRASPRSAVQEKQGLG